MKCDPVVITQFLNGELAQAEMEETLAHLDECRCCAATFRDLLAVRTMAPEIRAGLAPSVRRAAPGDGLVRRWAWMYGGLAAALLLLLGGLYLVRGYLPRTGPAWQAELETNAFTYVGPVLRTPAAPVDQEREAIMALYADGDYPEFVRQSSGWLRHHSDDRQVIFFTGVASYLEGRYAVAATYLEWAAEINAFPPPETGPKPPPETGRLAPPEVRWYLANTYLRQDLPGKAEPLLRSLAGTDHPYAPRARAILALMGH